MNIKRVITVIIIAVLLNIIFLPKAFALSDIIKNGDDFLGASTETIIKEDNLKTTSSKIYNILLGIGIAVAVIIGAVLGIQFIFGSVEGKAKISEALVPYIVGCAVVFGAFGIWKIAVNTGNQLVPEKNADSSLSAARDAAHSDWEAVTSGEDISTWTDERLINYYNTQYVGKDIKDKITVDPRSRR